MKNNLLISIICGVVGFVSLVGIYHHAVTEIDDYIEKHKDDSTLDKVVNFIGIVCVNLTADWCTVMLLQKILNN